MTYTWNLFASVLEMLPRGARSPEDLVGISLLFGKGDPGDGETNASYFV